MTKKQKGAIIAAIIVTLSSLAACSLQSSPSNSKGLPITIEAKADDFVPKTRKFAPGMHSIRKEFPTEYGYSGDRCIPVPEGYMIVSVDNYNKAWSGTTYTAGFDVVYVNTVEVEATSSLREVAGGKTVEDFYDAGVVAGKDLTLVFTNGD